MTHRYHLGWIFLFLAVVAPVAAQHDQHHSPYADQESSGVAALSSQELSDLLAGAGMGMARPAELNQYPGPKHVLELSEELGLSGEQQVAVESLRATMQQEAQRLGEEIVEQERHLERRFVHRHIDEDTLRSLTAGIADLYGELRFVHLRAHLGTRAALSAKQIEGYDRLRGYSNATP